MSTNLNPACPENCDSLLPENTYNICKQNIASGEIGRIYLANGNAECFTDWTALPEWLARISEDSLDPDAIRQFRGIGDFPAGSNDEVVISLGQKYYGEKTFVVNFDIEDVSDENYNFLRVLECQNTVKMWFEAGGFLFGGNCGIDVNINANYVIERGQKSLHHIMLVISWDYNYHPERTASPIA